MDKDQIKQILFRYHSGLSNAQEQKAVESWYAEIQKNYKILLGESEIDQTGDRLFSKLSKHIHSEPQAFRKRFKWFGIAATGLAASLLLIFIWFTIRDKETPIIYAGSNKAFLSLPSGKTLDLKQLPAGKTVEIAGIQIRKTEDGEITYETLKNIIKGQIGENTLTVPKGGKFSITLPDGSNVQLNSDSELSYPTVFEDHQRVVKLKGEAFFAIARDTKKTFIVKTDRADVQVLGTKFNVQAYPEERLWRTYVEHGRVNVSNAFGSIVLNKGDQAEINSTGHIDSTPSSTHNTAWRDGFFYFDNVDIYTVARQIERWYNIPVEVDPRLEKLEFFGLITRQESANQLFEILEETNTIKAKITKNKIIIQPKTN